MSCRLIIFHHNTHLPFTPRLLCNTLGRGATLCRMKDAWLVLSSQPGAYSEQISVLHAIVSENFRLIKISDYHYWTC